MPATAQNRKARARRRGATAPAASAKTTGGKRAAQKERDVKITEKVVALRGKNETWSEISESLSITSGKAQFLFMCTQVRPKDRIKGDTDEELAAGIIEAREDQDLSWGSIAARAGEPEGRVKRLYEEYSGTSASGSNVAQKRAEAKGASSTKASSKRASGRTRRPAKGKSKAAARRRSARKGAKDPSPAA